MPRADARKPSRKKSGARAKGSDGPSDKAQSAKAPRSAASGKKGTKTKTTATRKKTTKKKSGSDEAVVANGASPAKSSRSKRQRAMDVIQFRSTSARMADAARDSVWAISSEKTTGMYEAAEDLAQQAEAERTEALADPESAAPPSEVRRSSRDLYGFFREELLREDAEDDPHAPWRQSQGRRRHELMPGLRPGELSEIEGRLGVALPPSLWDFFLEWSGGLLFVREHGQSRIVSPRAIIDEVRGPLCNTMLRPFLPVVDLGCGDYLALDMSKTNKSGEHPVHWWFGGEEKKKVAESFAAWLRKLVEGGGDPYWWA